MTFFNTNGTAPVASPDADGCSVKRSNLCASKSLHVSHLWLAHIDYPSDVHDRNAVDVTFLCDHIYSLLIIMHALLRAASVEAFESTFTDIE